MELNERSLDTLCGALAYALGIEPPKHAAPACPELVDYIDKSFGGQKADRILMYNPDAIAQWLYEKYPQLFYELAYRADIKIPFRTVMPSVTPVCFGTMYTGAQPEVHGIQAYEKPVITIDTLFDALIRAGKKPVIVAYKTCSMGNIFLNRNMDYYVEISTTEEINAIGTKLLLEDKHDVIILYNGNYDHHMHKEGPESIMALTEIHANVSAFAMFSSMVDKYWKHHNTLVGFAMDHGCHQIESGSGSHGLDMPEDLNITHWYKCYPKKEG